VRVDLRCTAMEGRAWREAAAAAGLSVPAWARKVANQAASDDT